MFKKTKKDIDFSDVICYNIEVAWRDGRVGLRRTTGNRVYPNRYQGFESLSLRQYKKAPNRVPFYIAEKVDLKPSPCNARNRVRIPRLKIDKLACQA